ncbi:HAD family hydrolase [Sinirhodobacter populi]|uniref:HAD family hydrolase n=1 Tax=Paenirhodobacter populi TaxID=2306993 RepID=A0A443JX43_9RHOB|nr:HAD family hydrolase [Sinirhodobacter populi]RWR25046.1 HAD family hydrolase [Sinirhodobacter populi]
MSAAAILFDLDETLFNRSASVRRFVECQFASLDLGHFKSLNELCDRFIELDARGSVPKNEVYRVIDEEIGEHRNPPWSDLFDDYEANAWRHAFAFEGMADLIVWLRNKGFLIGIVSNGQTHIQLRNLLALGLDRLVDTYLFSEQERCRKPDPEIFCRAAERLSVLPSDCIFVGDSPQADMAGSRSLGMKTIWFSNGAAWPTDFDWQPDATIYSLVDVRSALEQMGEA